MARPKLSKESRRIKMNLTVAPEVKEMADMIRIKKNISMSMFFEEYIRSEYRKMVKRGDLNDTAPLAGQMNIADIIDSAE